MKELMAAIASRGVVIILGFFSSLIIARMLSPDGRGQFGVASAITALGAQIGILGFHFANTYHVSKKPSLLPTLVSNSLFISGVMGGLTMVFLFIFRNFVYGENSISMSLLIVSLINIPLTICFYFFQGLLTGIQKFKEFNLSEVLNKFSCKWL